MIIKSSFIEQLLHEDYEVIYFTDELDEYVMQVRTVLMLYVIYTDVYVLQAHAFWWGLTCGDIISSFIKQLLCKDYKDYKVITSRTSWMSTSCRCTQF